MKNKAFQTWIHIINLYVIYSALNMPLKSFDIFKIQHGYLQRKEIEYV